MTYEPANGLTLGAVEEFAPQHRVVQSGQSVGRLSLVLEWYSQEREASGRGAAMRCPLVRGAPYTTMEYVSAAPLLVAQRRLSVQPLGGFHCIINLDHDTQALCSFLTSSTIHCC